MLERQIELLENLSKSVVLSENFTLYELLRSSTARTHGLSLQQFQPPRSVCENLYLLVRHCLQPLREVIDEPVSLNSGYRCPDLNKLVSGSSNSDHIYGRAADITVGSRSRTPNKALFDALLESDIPFKQLIWEFGDKKSPSWVHISYNHQDALDKKDRRQVLFAGKNKSGGVFYKEFLGKHNAWDFEEWVLNL